MEDKMEDKSTMKIYPIPVPEFPVMVITGKEARRKRRKEARKEKKQARKKNTVIPCE